MIQLSSVETLTLKLPYVVRRLNNNYVKQGKVDFKSGGAIYGENVLN